MTQSIKDVFYHAMMARAAYVDIYSQVEMMEQIQTGQSGMTEKMAEYFTDHFAFVTLTPYVLNSALSAVA